MEAKIYVGNMPYNTTEEDLRTLFSQAGSVTSVAVIKDRDTGQPKGFAFVEMSSQAEAQKAINMFNGHQLNERALTVSLARPREERGGGFGDRRGTQGRGGYGDRRGGPGGRDKKRGSGPRRF
jgi:RNA recognition motif-containing protein